jgi:hypothetical protein
VTRIAGIIVRGPSRRIIAGIIAMTRKLLLAAALFALSTGLAQAQAGSYGGSMDNAAPFGYNVTGSARSPEDKARDEEIERKYNDTVQNKIPDKKGKKDPWATVRSTPAK